jgi:D-3-phosphoglycerate dehydrogenase / 2-oxoglutarate reductase
MIVDCLLMTKDKDAALQGVQAAPVRVVARAGQLPVVVVADTAMRAPDEVIDHFRGRATVRQADLSSAAKMRAATAGAGAVVVALQLLTAELIDAMDAGIRVIGRMGIGTDTVDLDAAAAAGITVFNEPTFGVPEVASHAIAMVLAVHRKLAQCDRHVRDGWAAGVRLDIRPVKPLDESVVGIVGYGRIGRMVAEQIAPMVGSVVAFDPLLAEGEFAGVARRERLDDLLAESDVVSVHAPLTPQSRGMLGRRELALLPRGAVLVNVSRGGQVDELALAELLASGHLGGAGLDVFEHEPLPADSPLLQAPNVLLSPHIAGYSDRSSWRLGAWTVGDAIEWLSSGRLEHGAIVVAGTR